MNKTGTLSYISMLFVNLYETNSECSSMVSLIQMESHQ